MMAAWHPSCYKSWAMLDAAGYGRGVDRFIRLRWLASAATLGFLAFGKLLHPNLRLGPALFAAALIPLTNLGHRALARRALSPRFLLLGQFGADLVLLTALLGTLGGVDGPFIPLYLLHVILAALLLDRRDALGITLAAVALMGLLAVLQALGAPFPLRGVTFYSTLLGLEIPLARMLPFVFGQVVMLGVVSVVTLILLRPLVREVQERGERLEAAQAEARTQKAALEGMLDATGAMMMVLDEKHRLVWLNRGVRERFPGFAIGVERRCYDPAEPMGGEDPPRCPTCYVQQTKVSFSGDYTLAVPGAAARVYRVSATPLEVGHKVPRVVELIVDVTRERENDQKLLEAKKTAAVATLAAGVAHEMNTPLASLAAGLRSVRRACATAADKEDGPWTRVLAVLDDLTSETVRCQRVTESLLGYSRQLRSHIDAVELGGLVRGAIDDLGSRRDVAGIEVVHEGPRPETPEVHCDPDQLRLVLLNVLANAVDSVREAHRSKGRVHVSVCRAADGDAVEIHVKDNGVGVLPEVVERLFDPFFTTKPIGQGTGLGLAMSRGLLDGMGATISVKSEPGRGADVIVRLSTAAGRALGAALAASRGSPSHA